MSRSRRVDRSRSSWPGVSDGLVHGDDGGDLDGLEGAVVEVALDLSSATISSLPTRKPTRQPAIENDLVKV